MCEAMAEFTSNFLNCLADTSVAERMQLIFEPMFKAHLYPITGKMADSIRMLTQTVDALKKECDSKDLVIRKLNQDVAQLQSRVDDLEQHGRKDSVRIFGLSEDTPGTTDEKVLRLCNQRMKLQPPLTMDEIAISHRVGKVKQPAADGSPGAPCALLVKFANRRSKNRVIAVRKMLKPGNQQSEGQTSENDDDEDVLADGTHIYISDDLTKARANLAFRARQAKRSHQISDTWVIDCKVMVKDNFSRISQVTFIHDLETLLQHWHDLWFLHMPMKYSKIRHSKSLTILTHWGPKCHVADDNVRCNFQRKLSYWFRFHCFHYQSSYWHITSTLVGVMPWCQSDIKPSPGPMIMTTNSDAMRYQWAIVG